jgi:hypothetical protein
MARLLREKLPLIGSLGEAWQSLRDRMFDSYRPELHYMRGPGPKTREKRGG